jgi:hypothetical protein
MCIAMPSIIVLRLQSVIQKHIKDGFVLQTASMFLSLSMAMLVVKH